MLSDTAPEKQLNKQQIALHTLIKFMHEKQNIGYRKIAKKLNGWGIKSKTGITQWKGNNVYGILKREQERQERIAKREQKYAIEVANMEIKLL